MGNLITILSFNHI